MNTEIRPEIRLATPDDLPALHPMSQRLAAHLGEAPRATSKPSIATPSSCPAPAPSSPAQARKPWATSSSA